MGAARERGIVDAITGADAITRADVRTLVGAEQRSGSRSGAAALIRLPAATGGCRDPSWK